MKLKIRQDPMNIGVQDVDWYWILIGINRELNVPMMEAQC